MKFPAVVHVMKTACKRRQSAVSFCKTPTALSGVVNSGPKTSGDEDRFRLYTCSGWSED